MRARDYMVLSDAGGTVSPPGQNMRQGEAGHIQERGEFMEVVLVPILALR